MIRGWDVTKVGCDDWANVQKGSDPIWTFDDELARLLNVQIGSDPFWTFALSNQRLTQPEAELSVGQPTAREVEGRAGRERHAITRQVGDQLCSLLDRGEASHRYTGEHVGDVLIG